MKYSPRFAYTFTPGSSLLDLSANTTFNIKGLLAVINATTGGTVYAIGTTGYGYSAFANNVLTLQASMAGMTGSDTLIFFYDDGNAQNIDPESGLAPGFTALRDHLTAQRYTILADSIADGLATFWTQTNANGGSVSVVSGEGLIQTSTATNGSAQLSSTAPPYYPGQVAWMNSAIRFGDTGSVGNIRRIGVFTVSGTTPQDGCYYELTDTTLNAVTVKAGVATATAVTSWSRAILAPFTLDVNYHQFEIRWTSNRADFMIDNVLRHTVAGTTAPITGTLNFPMTIQSINSSGATNRIIAVRNIGIGRFGNPDAALFSPDTTLQAAAAATGNGTVMNTIGYGVAIIQVTGAFVGTLTLEGTVDGTNYVAIVATQETAAAIISTITGPGIYRISVAGLNNIRARISSYTSGTITAVGHTLNAPYAAKFVELATGANTIGNIGSITTLPALPTGSNVIGAVTQSGTWNATINTALPTGANTIGIINQGTANTAANAWMVKNTDGTNSITIKPASTASVATDTALVVAVSPNNTLPILSANATASGTISATDAVVAVPAGDGSFRTGASTANSTVFIKCPGGDSAWTVAITGLTSGTLYFEASPDSTNGADGNWINVNGRQTGIVNTVLSGNATANGMYRGNTAGVTYFRVRSVGALSGTPTVKINTSSGPGAVFLNASIPAGTNTIGNINSITTLPALATGANVIGAVTQSGTWNATINTALPTGANVIGAVTQSGTWNIGAITTLPALATGANTIGIVNQGTAATAANAWMTKTTDGTNVATVKAASTAAIATDPALVVAISPNNTVASTQSGTWNINAITTLPALPTGSNIIGGIIGDVASGTTDANAPLKIGGQARITNPTAVTDGQRVNAIFDKLGKQIVVGAVRDLKARQRTNIAASTAETTIVTAIASVFNDLYGLVITNNGSATMAVTIRDVAAGTPVMVFEIPATDTRGFMVPVDSALPQAAVNTAWTAACTPNATSVDITAFYVKNL